MKKPKDFSEILERISTSENWRDGRFRDRWKEYLKMYRSEHLTKPEAGRSSVYVPYTFMQVETIKARVAESLFATRPFVTMLPRGDNDVDKAKAIQMLLDWQFNDRMNIEALFSEDVLSDACILGTAVTFTGWMKKTRKVKGRENVSVPLTYEDGTPVYNEFGAPVMTEVQEVVTREKSIYDDPLVQRVDLFDFYTDPFSTNTQDARYCGHREWLTKDDIKAREADSGWEVNWDELEPDESASGGKKIRAEVIGESLDSAGDSYKGEDGKGLYLVHHYWEDDRHVVIINEKECAIDEENPFWHGRKPYDKCCYVPLTNEFYGMGVPEILHDLQAELNTSRNQRLDYNSMTLRRMWKMRKGCGLTAKDLVWRQNGIIQVEDMEDLIEINVQELPASAFTNEEVIKRDMRDATGCHDIIMGLTTTSDETATTTMTKDNNASIRFKAFIGAVVNNMLIPIAQKCVSLDQQFMDTERLIRIFDNPQYRDEIIRITPDDVNGSYDMSYAGTSVEPIANKENYKNNMLAVYNLAMSNPLVQQDPQAMLAILKELYVANEVKDVESKMPNLQQQQQNLGNIQGEVDKIKQLLAEKAQGGGGAAPPMMPQR